MQAAHRGNPHYTGRFAPSPSGPLHFGSLVAAVASYADARHYQGEWLLRIDDVDEARTVAGAADHIMKTLEAFGLEWDQAVNWQSRRKNHYLAIIDQLVAVGVAYPCGCSRSEIERLGRRGAAGMIYPGTCRAGLPAGRTNRSIRLRTPARSIVVDDRFCGLFGQKLATEIGDFVIRRTDGFAAYQLAVVVDDQIEGITHVVRGADLLESTPRQIYLQELLDYPNPQYGHLPLVLDAGGQKLSKQDSARPVCMEAPLPALKAAWRFLGQADLDEGCADVEAFWTAAIPAWSTATIPTKSSHLIP